MKPVSPISAASVSEIVCACNSQKGPCIRGPYFCLEKGGALRYYRNTSGRL